nr:glycosyltransferase [Paracoccus saliphilus]
MNEVAVIIPAHNAGRTIAQAIRSALAEPEVFEVVVVDDASGDNTAAVAQGMDDGSGRLRVMALPRNVGPARARNLAIAASTAPWIAILDSDDAFLPGRFARLFAHRDWDLAADNIVLIPDHYRESAALPEVPDFHDDARMLSLPAFIAGNLTSGRMARNETGLLKPVMRRSLLEKTGLAYDEDLRLGEDFILYVRLMARGARFLTIRSCGYVAFQRGDSLSAQHRTDDLGSYARAARQILAQDPLSDEARSMLIRQERLTRNKYHHRLFLDRKRARGLADASTEALRDPRRVLPILRLTARDKYMTLMRRLGLAAVPHHATGIRFLLEGRTNP